MTDVFRAKLVEIRARFVVALEIRGQMLVEAIDSIETGRNLGPALRAAQMELHKIAGTAAPLGFKKLGELAVDLEDRIEANLACSEPNRIELKIDLIGLLETIESVRQSAKCTEVDAVTTASIGAEI